MPAHRPLIRVNCQTAVLALLLIITLVGGWLRFGRIGDKSLWIDEAFSVWMARRPIPEMLSWLVRIDQHPPLYYLLLRFWMQIGDALGWTVTPQSAAAWARALSALFSTLNIPVLYALGRRLAGRKVGLLAALVLALSPFHVYLAQEARMYTLLCLNVSVATLAWVRLLDWPPPRPSPVQTTGEGAGLPPVKPGGTEGADFSPVVCTGGTEGGPAWAAYILFTATALWTHNTAILFFFAVNLYSLAQRNRVLCNEALPEKPGFLPQELQSPPLRHWTSAQMGVLLLWLPWIQPFIRQAMGVDREFWIPAPTWSMVVGAIHNMMSAFLPFSIPGLALLWILCVTAVLWGVNSLRTRPALLSLLVTLFLTPIACELLISLRRPVFYDRTLIWASIPLYLLMAIGLDVGQETRFLGRNRVSLGRHIATALGLLLLAALNVSSLHEYYSNYQKEQWDDAAAYVAQRVQEGDLILYHASWTQLPFDFYFPTGARVVRHGVPVDLFNRDILEPKMTEADLAQLLKWIQGHDRIWLVYSHNWYTDPQGLIPAALASHAPLASRRSFNGLEIYLYERASHPALQQPCSDPIRDLTRRAGCWYTCPQSVRAAMKG